MREPLPRIGAQPSRGARIAFFGGSFDPPHLGHLAVARAARAALGLDAVLFAPVGAQPLKPGGSTASYADRLAMTRLAIAGERGFSVSLADAPKLSGAPNFTLETLLGLRAELPPDGSLFCLMGADSFFCAAAMASLGGAPVCRAADCGFAPRPAAGRSEGCAARGTEHGTRSGCGRARLRCRGPSLSSLEPGGRMQSLLPASGLECRGQRLANPKPDSISVYQSSPLAGWNSSRRGFAPARSCFRLHPFARPVPIALSRASRLAHAPTRGYD